MLRNARHFIRTILIAVAVLASGVNGYASVLTAFDTHSHGEHGLHTHDHGIGDHQAGADAEHIGDVAEADTQDTGNPAADGQVCKHIHAYCCAMFAMAAADCGLSLGVYPRVNLPIADSLIPHGQIGLQLFRPPRQGA